MSLSKSNAAQYEAQLQQMHLNALAWLRDNPDKTPSIQYNFPTGVAVIGLISDAITHHYVSTDESGLDLLHHLWPWGESDEPTVLMCKVVLEYTFKGGDARYNP